MHYGIHMTIPVQLVHPCGRGFAHAFLRTAAGPEKGLGVFLGRTKE